MLLHLIYAALNEDGVEVFSDIVLDGKIGFL